MTSPYPPKVTVIKEELKAKALSPMVSIDLTWQDSFSSFDFKILIRNDNIDYLPSKDGAR